MPNSFDLLKEKSKFFRFDLIFGVVLYPLTIFPSFLLIKQSWVSGSPKEVTETTFSFITDHLDIQKLEPYTFRVILPFIVLLIHLFVYLLSFWSIKIRMLLFFDKCGEKEATKVVFYPKKHKGQTEIVDFVRSSKPYAIYQQKKREFIDGQFVSMKYPTNREISQYLASKGHTDAEAHQAKEYFGHNNYDIPVPSFIELLKEHMLAPFFVFQVFSILCWMLDDYLTYPIVSLVSLILIESNTVRTRQSNLIELRGVKNTPFQIWVNRDETWRMISTDKLVPGDLVLLDKNILCPADMLVLAGRVVVNEAMLTGESTPQVKESVQSLPPSHILDISKDKRHILFGGTRIEQIIEGENHIYIPKPGALAYVLSTGLGSSQGRLLRTILFASERVSAESKDAMKLLLFLTIFAVAAAGYVIYYGINNTSISSFRLIVEVIKIITSTIPPDLPMELTFSVNASLLALSKLSVFCTEPFRIPFAGTVSVCCFDKTGTITAEEYVLVGIDEMIPSKEPTICKDINGYLEIDQSILSQETQTVIGGCHSLVRGTNGKLVGDSLESEAFSKLGFSITQSNNIKNKRVSLTIHKTFHFSAELRRMSSVVSILGTKNNYVVTKGAPEIIAQYLSTIPSGYYERFRSYTSQGCRVLALAYKKLSGDARISEIERESAEKELIFAGFIIFAAPFKRGSEDTIVELLRSTHRVIIITGDDPLTACHVARKVHILNCDPIICDEEYNDKANCFTGRSLDTLTDTQLDEVCHKCNVFARMSPNNKATIVSRLKSFGFNTLMCGDGTNDVGALKKADVGVGLLEKSIETSVDDEEYKPKLGAASVAAPFVSKRSTISACVDLIRFGRATLSSTIDLFKLLSLNCLISAYSSSVLFIDNVKFGDQQMTIFALFLSVSFMAISWAKPVRKLSKERPFDSQFNPYLVTSVLLQFGVHLVILILTEKLVFSTNYQTPAFDFKVKFTPSLMNTAMFIITNEMQIATFVANYRGAPFMQSFLQNKLLFWSIAISTGLMVIILFDAVPEIRELFELVSFPSLQFRNTFGLYCLLDFILCILIEKVSLFFFTFVQKRKTNNLVDPTVLESISDYKMQNDDVLPEESHKFNLIDMFKSNFQLQKRMMEQRTLLKAEELNKNHAQKKGTKKTNKK